MPESSGKGPLVTLLGCLGVLLVATITLAAFTAGMVFGKARPAAVSAPTSEPILAAAPTVVMPNAATPTALAQRGAPTAVPTVPPLVSPTPTRAVTPTATRVTPSPTRPAGGAAATPLFRTIDLPANDLVYDPHTRQFWASVPGKVRSGGNSVVTLDPETGKIGTPLLIGSEPDRLALSDDGRYLYVGLDGAGAVRRVNLADRKAEEPFSLGAGQVLGMYFPADLAIVPGSPGTVVVARRYHGVSPDNAGAAVYADGVKLPNEVADRDAGTSIAFCGAGATLYTYDGGRRLTVNASGVTAGDKLPELLTSNGNVHQLRCDDGKLYGSGGEVVDVATDTLVGRYAGIQFTALVCPDSTVGRVFFLDAGYAEVPRLYVFDQATFTLIASVDLPGLPKALSPGRRLVRWGEDGLAYSTGDQVILLRSPLVSGKAATAPTPGAPRPTPAPPATPTATAPAALPTIATLDLPTNDLVYDARTNLLWASVPGEAGAIGNSVVPIDPATGKIGTPIPVGSEPDQLALSDDGHYLYVGLDGASAVRRVNLDERKAEIQIPLGADPQMGAYLPGDIAVMPGHPNTIAVVRRYGSTGSGAPAGVALYVDGAKLPKEPEYPASTEIGAITFCGSATTLYGYDSYSSGSSFIRLAVDDSGLSVIDTTRSLLSEYGARGILCVDGRIYTTNGEVLNPETKTLSGTYANLGFTSPVRPDPAAGRVYFLIVAPNEQPKVLVYDLQTFVRVGSFEVPGLTYPTTARGLLRWGADGLAFRTDEGKVYLLRSPLVGGGP